jgi:hypothetical protein
VVERLTTVGLENIRVKVFVEMIRAGATKSEAFAYIDLIYPFEKKEKNDGHDGRG